MAASTIKPAFSNPLLQLYLEYIEESEPSYLFHTWSLIGGIAAMCGRRVYLRFGAHTLYPNQYIVLVGPPGARKGTALRFLNNRLKVSTNVRYAPDDTSGQRQGLIAAFNDTPPKELNPSKQLEKDIGDLFSTAGPASVPTAASLSDLSFGDATVPDPSHLDRNVLFAKSDEFDSLIGTNQRELLTFLCRMWDGDDYSYQLKSERKTLNNALLTILGATTPNNIAESLPPGSIGQGFTSRLILVHSDGSRMKIPRPQDSDPKICKEIETIFTAVNTMSHEIVESPAAAKLLEELYMDECRTISDSRFVYYYERRQTHLIKLCICLASARQSNIIDLEDVQEAEAILSVTEQFMPDALGEFGLSPHAAAKQKVLDIVRSSVKPMSGASIYQIVRADVRSISDFHILLQELVQADKLVKLSGPMSGLETYVYNAEANKPSKKILDMMEQQAHDQGVVQNVVQLRAVTGDENVEQA